AGSNGDTDTLAVAIVDIQATIANRLNTRYQAILNEGSDLARFLRGYVLGHIQIPDQACKTSSKIGDIVGIDHADPTPAFHQSLPGVRYGIPKRGNGSHTGNNDSAT